MRAHRAGFGIFAGLIALFMIGAVVMTVAFYSGSATMACIVTDKDRSSTEDGSVYQVYTEDCGVLRVSDNPLKGVFNAADIYGQIEPDRVYEFQTFGWRMPLLSQFPTIYEVREITNG